MTLIYEAMTRLRCGAAQPIALAEPCDVHGTIVRFHSNNTSIRVMTSNLSVISQHDVQGRRVDLFRGQKDFEPNDGIREIRILLRRDDFRRRDRSIADFKVDGRRSHRKQLVRTQVADAPTKDLHGVSTE